MKKLALLSALAALALSAPAAQAVNNVTVGHSNWFWGNPQPQGSTLRAIDFAGGTGYAAGDFGTLLKTTDNGLTWQGIPTGIRADLNQVRVLDSHTVIVGAGCLLRRSDDGGATFTRIRVFADERSCPANIVSFYFLSANVGYVLLSDGTVQRTDDGGQSFQLRTAVPGTAATHASPAALPTDLYFRTTDTGFATAGGTIYRTTDGGGSWQQVSTGSTLLNGLLFADADTGYAVGNVKTLLKTTDGGAMWTPVPIPASIPAVDLTKIRCASGNPQLCLIATSLGDRLLRTEDGGTTITSVSPSTNSVLAAAFGGPASVVAVGVNGTTAISADSGQNWAPVGSLLTATLSRLRATSSQVVYATGDNGALARSTNGGADWSKVNVASSEDTLDVSFPDQTTGFALDTAGSVRKTTNGGQTWTPLDTGGLANPRALFAPDPNTLLLILPKGLARTTDPDNTPPDTVADAKVRKASFTDYDQAGSAIWFYGPRALFLTTNKGGRFKSVVRPGGRKAIIENVDFVSTKVGYVLNRDGRVWGTRDGGRKWTESTGTGTQGAYDMAWGDAKNGYLAIDGFGSDDVSGYVLRTDDGGKNWRPQLIAPNQIQDNGLVATAAKNAFALAGTNGLFYTTAGGDQGTPSALTIKSNVKKIRKPTTITISGRLSPAVAGADVYVSFRDAVGRGRWTTLLPKPTSGNGSFTIKRKVSRPTIVVAQWLGDADHDSDGSAVLTIKR